MKKKIQATMKSKPGKTKPKTQETEAEEWDFSQGMGILPVEIPFTQNIGCVGSSRKKLISKKSDFENKS